MSCLQRFLLGFDIFWCRNERDGAPSISMNGSDKVKERVGQHFTPETCLHQAIFMGMMSEVPISSQGPKGCNAQFLQYVERKCSLLKKVQAWVLHVRGFRRNLDGSVSFTKGKVSH